jgi:hypothetical protein
MRSGTRFILALLPAVAVLLIPSFAGAGEGTYNPVYAACAVPHPTASALKACEEARKARAPAKDQRPPPVDWSYFCTAIHVPIDPKNYRVYQTAVHHLGVYNSAGPNSHPIDDAWAKEVGLRDPHLSARCVYSWTSRIQSEWQANRRANTARKAHIVNVDWEYRQNVPALIPNQ